MESAQMPGCCGITVLHGFGHTATSRVRDKFEVSKVEEWIDSLISYNDTNAFLMIALNSEQFPVYKDLVKNKGFKFVDEAFHPRHDTTIYIFIRNMQESLKTKAIHAKEEEVVPVILARQQPVSKPKSIPKETNTVTKSIGKVLKRKVSGSKRSSTIGSKVKRSSSRGISDSINWYDLTETIGR